MNAFWADQIALEQCHSWIIALLVAGQQAAIGQRKLGQGSTARMTLLDPHKLTEKQLKQSMALLEKRAAKQMLPFNEIDVDSARAELDAEFFIAILGLPEDLAKPDGPLELLRRKLSAEPSIHGSKKSKVHQ